MEEIKDMDLAPIIPQAPAGLEPMAPIANTNPMTPANPASPEIGVQQGIETMAAD